MASNQIRHNVEMGTAMTNSFIKMSGMISKETTAAFENARNEMMASAERMRNEMMASAERMRNEMMASAEKMKDNFNMEKRKS
jgi:hypothetical protein